MNNTIQTLNPTLHQALKIDDSQAIKILEKSHLLHLRANEVAQAVCTYPVFFTRETQAGHWTISALCAFGADQNVFVNEGKWLAGYTPKSIKTQPLVLVNAENDNGYEVGINTQHPCVSSEHGDVLFNQEQKPSLYLLEKMRLLESALSDDRVTLNTLKRLDELGLISDVDMIIEYSNGSKQAINGLATPNESVLATLDAATLHKMEKDGVLIILHAMLLSLFQVNSLIRLHNTQNPANSISNIKFEAPKSRTAGDAL